MYKRALVSVSDKTGLEEFLGPLAQQGLELVSTGGTGEFLKSKGFQVTDVKDLTGWPEVLSGRVKTLHPHIHIALLAREWVSQDQEVLRQYGIQPFDLVVGHLYPFEEQSAGLEERELAEWIDVGGPSFLRAAGKNYFSITTLCHPEDYPLAQKGTDLKTRKHLAVKVFELLAHYDSVIANRLKSPLEESAPPDFFFKGRVFKELRYGENPHQKAYWLKQPAREGLHTAEILQGKALSYNNLLDLWTAVLAVRDFKEPCAVAVKHNSPCGAAVADSLSVAVENALKADPLSVFGGLLAFNRPLDERSAQLLSGLFLEGLIAPDFSPSALQALKSKKSLRILKWPDMLSFSPSPWSIREVAGGFLSQTRDQIQQDWPEIWKCFGETPSEELKQDMLFAWKICSHLKSNAIAVVKKKQTLGLGMGQVSRVDAVRLALERAKRFHPRQTTALVLASDAFFPFPDSIELAAQEGVSWIIQPGGSVKDELVLKKARERGLNVVLTGQRHFKH